MRPHLPIDIEFKPALAGVGFISLKLIKEFWPGYGKIVPKLASRQIDPFTIKLVLVVDSNP